MKIINLLVYGNFLIAMCAYAQTLQTLYFLGYPFSFGQSLPVFVAFATFFLYNIHKPITFFLKNQLIDNQRFLKTKTFSIPLSILTVLAGLVCLYLFFQLQLATQVSLLIAAFFSLAYVLPIFNGKRLRDFPYVKIFTIAFVWSLVTVLLPFLDTQTTINRITLLILSEKSFFVFALTLPFDIRDMDWDTKTDVKTIPLSIGVKKTKILALFCLFICAIHVILLFQLKTYSLKDTGWLITSYAISGMAVGLTQKEKNDYFFYGLIDGMLLLQTVFLLLLGHNV
ncbi:MAG: UbiA family prenyltransferase [Saprospiraceae bacterium]|nr:UbiA family prenyltransferase [Saprospiraceae bacterium]